MRRLDSLELERAMEEIRLLVKDGQLTHTQADPVIVALFKRGMTEEADDLFIESCQRICRTTTIIVEVVEAASLPDDEVPFGNEDDDEYLDDTPYWLEEDENVLD